MVNKKEILISFWNHCRTLYQLSQETERLRTLLHQKTTELDEQRVSQVINFLLFYFMFLVSEMDGIYSD